MAPSYRWLDDFVRRGWIKKGILSPGALRLLLAMGLHMNSKTAEAWPGIKTLIELTGMGQSSVFDALAELRTAGLIETATRTIRGRFREYQATVYRLRPVPPSPAEYHSRNSEDYHSENSERTREDAPETGGDHSSSRVQTTVKRTEVLSTTTDQFLTPANGEGPQQLEQPELDNSQLLELISQWLHDNLGEEPLERKARICAHALQAQGVCYQGTPPWTLLVLEIMQALQANREVASHG